MTVSRAAIDAAYEVMAGRVYARTGRTVGDPVALEEDLIKALRAADKADGEVVTKVFPAGPGYSNSLLFQAPGGYEEDPTSVHVSFDDIVKIMGEHTELEAVEITIRRIEP